MQLNKLNRALTVSTLLDSYTVNMLDFILTIILPFVSLGAVATICIILCVTIAISRYQKCSRVALRNKNKWYRFPLIKKTSITHNTNMYVYFIKIACIT